MPVTGPAGGDGDLPGRSRFLTRAPSGADARRQAAMEVLSQGFKLYQQGDHKGAVERFELALSIDPNVALGHYYMAESLKALGRPDEAFAHYEATARLAPDTKEGLIASRIPERAGVPGFLRGRRYTTLADAPVHDREQLTWET
jgi:tetratricopeptide (TPR) repeat protein